MIKIRALKKALKELGIICSLDQIRKLEKWGIVFPNRTKGGQRVFTEEMFKVSLRNILFYYFNTPLVEIRSDDKELLGKRAKLILKAARVVQRGLA